MNSLLAPPTLPQSPTDLHAERTYLLTSLQIQNRTANDILHKLASLEEKLQPHHDFPAAVRRRVRKQINWFKHRLSEVNRQKQAVSARLGQIEGEIQARERIAQLEHEKWRTWLDYVYGTQIQLHGPVSPEHWYTGHEQNAFGVRMSPGFVELSQQQQYQQSYLPVPPQDATSPSYFPPSALTVASPSIKLSPLSPSFEPSGIFTLDSLYLQLPWQHWLESASIRHPPQQQYRHHQQDGSRHLSLGTELQLARSSTEVSPTRTNHNAQKENTTGDASKSASLSSTTNRETNTDPIGANDIISPTLDSDVSGFQSPHSRRNSTFINPKQGTRCRPVSMDYGSPPRTRKGSMDDDSPDFSVRMKRHLLPNLDGGGQGRRKSLPV